MTWERPWSSSRRALVAAILACALSGRTRAAVLPAWTAIGPEGGVVNAVATDPHDPATVYAATAGGGVFKSSDRGGHWQPANQGLTDLAVTTLVVDPVATSTLYAGTQAHGVFRSSDGGATWQPSSAGLPGAARFPAIGAIAVDPQVPAVVYVGLAGSGGGVFKSSNGGGHWDATGSELTQFNQVHALAIDAASPATVFAGTSDGLWRSLTAGASWTQVDPGHLAGTQVESVAVATSGAIYAAESSDLWKSTDGGDLFALLPAMPSVAPLAASGTGGDSGAELVGTQPAGRRCRGAELASSSAATALPLAITPDRSVRRDSPTAPWAKDVLVTPFPTPTPVPALPAAGSGAGVAAGTRPASALQRLIAFMVVIAASLAPHDAAASLPATSDPMTLVVATDGGVFTTTDDGAHWAAPGAGLTTRDTRTIAVTPGATPRLFVGSGGAGVFATDDLTAWQALDTGLVATQVRAFAFPSPGVVLAASSGAGVQRSVDGGLSWSTADSGGLEDAIVNAFAVVAGQPATVWAATDGGVFESGDGGATWVSVESGIADGLAYAVVVDPTNPTSVYVGGSGGVRRSADGGARWEDGGSGLGAGLVLSLAIDPVAPQTLYAGVYGRGVFRSADGAASWHPMNGGQGFLSAGVPYAIAVDPVQHQTVYAGLDGQAVWKSLDGGASWARAADGLLDQNILVYSTILGLAIDPANPSTIYAAAGPSGLAATPGPVGVFASTDGGSTWHALGGVLDGVPALSIAVDPASPASLFAGTGGLGAFRLGPLPGLHPRRHLRRSG